mmetsp:Transcript_14619/g.14248  ORF Transcript_14619/g.14248 Transcript_14619/m.14248 type:complete len:109 (+) Transcript_14619:193-519(+)
MMDELAEYDNLIRALGALFYTSKKMTDLVPCIFQAWKERSFEKRASNIINIMSDQQLETQKKSPPKPRDDFSEEYDEEDFDEGNQEEFMKVERSDHSCTIIPATNIKP